MKTLIVSSTLLATLLLAAPGAVAQDRGAFCLRGSDSGNLNCAYDTMAQCQQAMKGTSTESCVTNPNRTTGSGAAGSGAAGSGAAGSGAGAAPKAGSGNGAPK
jgi:hypothetical protein